MMWALLFKVVSNDGVLRKLKGETRAFVEGSRKDTFWGVGYSKEAVRRGYGMHSWGQNMMGRLLGGLRHWVLRHGDPEGFQVEWDMVKGSHVCKVPGHCACVTETAFSGN